MGPYVDLVIKNIIGWLYGLIAPLSKLNELVADGALDNPQIILGFWVCPVALSVIIEMLALQVVHGPAEGSAYYVVLFVIAFVKLLMVPVTGSLLLFAVSSRTNLAALLLAFTVYVIYSPILTIAEIPSLWQTFREFSYLIKSDSNIWDSMQTIVAHPKEFGQAVTEGLPHLRAFVIISSFATDPFYIVSIVFFGEVTRKYLNLRLITAYMVGCLAFSLAMLPQLFLTAVQWLAAFFAVAHVNPT